MSARSGLFITFEGGEGSGKTTQIKRLAERLEKAGHGVTLTREPGGTPFAERIRTLVVEGKADAFDAVTETLLFLAARRDHVDKVIRPALAEGKTVLCDRFLDSTLVYQGMAKGLGVEYVRALSRLAIGSFAPDITFLFDIDPEAGLARTRGRGEGENRFESHGLEFHRRVREGFLTLTRAEPGRFRVIDAAKTPDEVADMVWKGINN